LAASRANGSIKRARFEQTLASSVLAHIDLCCAREDWGAATSVADAYLQRDALNIASGGQRR
jgi:hypothetical protein